MEYNTQRNKIIVPEYGRNIQKMVEYLPKIEDKDKRNRLAKEILDIIIQQNPQLKNIENAPQMVWNQMVAMTDYKLKADIGFPYPNKIEQESKPNKIAYSQHKIKYRYYGIAVEKMIKFLSELEENEAKERMVKQLAYYMKRSQYVWNGDNVNEKVICDDIKKISENRITLDESKINFAQNQNNNRQKQNTKNAKSRKS